ncbi:MAG: hypothetical protein Q4E07_06095 [Eubacteriales bacterium]|nr:hypothetical protein [Eubacteriales bacterium]
MEDFNKEDKSKQEEFKEQEPQNDFGDTIKRVAMTAIGGVADAAEAIAKGVQSAANKENIDRLAQKGENAVKQVKDFSESAAKQVLDFGSDTVNKIKKAWDESKAVDAAQESVKSLEDDIMASLK